jgi:DNA helicase-2/ATP-dependent DNA helicase PcrA
VDWKTNRAHTADPVQLAVYRLAWSELHDLPLDQVRAAFHYVRDDDLVEPTPLADRPALESLLAGRG